MIEKRLFFVLTFPKLILVFNQFGHHLSVVVVVFLTSWLTDLPTLSLLSNVPLDLLF